MKNYINIRSELYDLSSPRVMGILNVAPDSFYKGSRALTNSAILGRISEMIQSGADIIDVGAYSSRPGAESISVSEEIDRLRVALNILKKNFPDQIVSLDTFRADVARVGIEDFAVDIINDISGGNLDREMFPLIADKNVPYILMHMQGRPETMQVNPQYDNVINDLLFWFTDKINQLVSMGHKDIIVDPGFGFGKTIDHNYDLLRGLNRFEVLDLPLLAGLSRKSMIWKALDTSPEDSLPATIALNMFALNKGASIIRVHDVAEAVQTVEIYKRLAP